jgi:hypothetical protein
MKEWGPSRRGQGLRERELGKGREGASAPSFASLAGSQRARNISLTCTNSSSSFLSPPGREGVVWFPSTRPGGGRRGGAEDRVKSGEYRGAGDPSSPLLEPSRLCSGDAM